MQILESFSCSSLGMNFLASNLAYRINMSIESTEMDNNTQLLIKIAKRAGHRAILKHRLAGISVTGSYHESSLIVINRHSQNRLSSDHFKSETSRT